MEKPVVITQNITTESKHTMTKSQQITRDRKITSKKQSIYETENNC